VGLLRPIIVILARLTNEITEDNVTSVVILIRTLLIRLASAAYNDGQEQLPKMQHDVNEISKTCDLLPLPVIAEKSSSSLIKMSSLMFDSLTSITP